jgi:predicted RNA binding protein YcfA (HicA-like mRNA interferase family)
MSSISGKRLARTLERHGWILQRIHGSHYIYAKVGCKERISIPIHGDRSLKSGLLQHLLRTAGIKESEVD